MSYVRNTSFEIYEVLDGFMLKDGVIENKTTAFEIVSPKKVRIEQAEATSSGSSVLTSLRQRIPTASHLYSNSRLFRSLELASENLNGSSYSSVRTRYVITTPGPRYPQPERRERSSPSYEKAGEGAAFPRRKQEIELNTSSHSNVRPRNGVTTRSSRYPLQPERQEPPLPSYGQAVGVDVAHNSSSVPGEPNATSQFFRRRQEIELNTSSHSNVRSRNEVTTRSSRYPLQLERQEPPPPSYEQAVGVDVAHNSSSVPQESNEASQKCSEWWG